ncbi:unnamed protein product [Pleuronectes platessa]|uniref:Uncharacterized protein n=1 Tax=Pleuronectes platessa TaxID=8262 RepID=A0A9N7USA1_PLEPL|nr:unnamed protein product [Pleuronectes platessa]
MSATNHLQSQKSLQSCPHVISPWELDIGLLKLLKLISLLIGPRFLLFLFNKGGLLVFLVHKGAPLMLLRGNLIFIHRQLLYVSAPQILNSDLPIGLRPLALLEGGSHLQEAPPHSLAENRDTFPAIHGQSGDGCSFLQTGKDLAKENEKNSLRFGPAPSRRRPQRLRDQRPEARTSSTSSFRDSRYYGRARNPAKQHERSITAPTERNILPITGQ